VWGGQCGSGEGRRHHLSVADALRSDFVSPALDSAPDCGA
jgi:hypothetical protein